MYACPGSPWKLNESKIEPLVPTVKVPRRSVGTRYVAPRFHDSSSSSELFSKRSTTKRLAALVGSPLPVAGLVRYASSAPGAANGLLEPESPGKLPIARLAKYGEAEPSVLRLERMLLKPMPAWKPFSTMYE